MIGITNANPLVPQWGGGHLIEAERLITTTSDWTLKYSFTLPNDGGYYLVQVTEYYNRSRPYGLLVADKVVTLNKVSATVENEFRLADSVSVVGIFKANTTLEVYSKEVAYIGNKNSFWTKYVKISN